MEPMLLVLIRTQDHISYYCTCNNSLITEEPKSETEKLRLLLSSEKCQKSFILRARVLKLYRQSLRVARRAPSHARAELENTIRQEIEKNRRCDDKQRIRFLISEGLEKLKGLDEMLDMQGN